MCSNWCWAMNEMTRQQQIDTLTTIRDMNRRSARELADRYGDGVRPAWVSAELSIYWHSAQRADVLLKLEEQNL